MIPLLINEKSIIKYLTQEAVHSYNAMQRKGACGGMSELKSLKKLTLITLTTIVSSSLGSVNPLWAGQLNSKSPALPSSKTAEPTFDLTTFILNQVFSAIGRPNFQTRIQFSFGSDGNSLDELTGRVQLPFTKALNGIPLVGDPTSVKDQNSAAVKQVAPVLDINTKNLVVQWDVNAFPEHGKEIISNLIQFQTKDGRAATLVGTVHSPLVDYYQLSVSSIKIDLAKGEQNGRFQVEGKCEASQEVVDIATGKLGRIPVVCKLEGYVTESGDRKLKFTYDTTGK